MEDFVLKKTDNGLFFDVQAFSLHDGPGCRTTFFLKGCPLRCRFCANPEGRERGRSELVMIDGSKKICGYELDVENVMRILRRDRQYWCEDGGATFSGGEPLMQAEFLVTALQACRESYIHTAIETSAWAEKQVFMQVLSEVDFAFFDIKHMDSLRHYMETGLENKSILANITALSASAWAGRAVVRLPLIPAFNDDENNLSMTAKFMKKVGLAEINILPFHRMGESKWRQCCMEYAYADCLPQGKAELQKAKRLFEQCGIKCYLGNETAF